MKRKKNKVRVTAPRWQDHYTRQAKRENYPARSVYKLKEIQSKYSLIRRGSRVLDLGCAPGAWLRYAAEVTGTKGLVVGIDLKPVKISLPAQVQTHVADITKLDDAWWQDLGIRFGVVLSDMAPATTGNRQVDALRSCGLCETAWSLAEQILIPGGHFVCKIFQGSDFKAFSDMIHRQFTQHRTFKPQSSRKASSEIYIIGMGKTGGAHVRT